MRRLVISHVPYFGSAVLPRAAFGPVRIEPGELDGDEDADVDAGTGVTVDTSTDVDMDDEGGDGQRTIGVKTKEISSPVTGSIKGGRNVSGV